MNSEPKVYWFDDGRPFGVVWYSKDDLFTLIEQEMEVSEPIAIEEITDLDELRELIFSMCNDQGEVILLNGIEIIRYLTTNNIILEGPLIS
ncbi:hypothetical protein ACTHQ2_23415, partial [Bacillus subtilis]|uniref:hypothetical protein n=1 Tax=Bacillus subtilis TaxID=1423 RepID=UPI003F7BAAF2